MKIGIDIGGSHIGIGLVDRNGNIVEKIEQDFKQDKNNSQKIIQYVENTIEKISKTVDIELIGIAAPGNLKEKKVTNLVNLGIKEIDFETIQKKFNIPIQINNDAKAAALAEKEYGSLKNYKDCVFLCIGTGIGGGVFLNNKLLKGNRNLGFEIGHMIINKEGIQCNCKKRGCFEAYCSIKRFKQNIIKQLKNIGIQEDIIPQEIISQIIINKENENLKIIIQEYIENLIIGISNIIDIFEPQCICLGGSFVYYKDIIYNEFIKQINEREYVCNWEQKLPEIILAQLKNDAGIIGATIEEAK